MLQRMPSAIRPNIRRQPKPTSKPAINSSGSGARLAKMDACRLARAGEVISAGQRVLHD